MSWHWEIVHLPRIKRQRKSKAVEGVSGTEDVTEDARGGTLASQLRDGRGVGAWQSRRPGVVQRCVCRHIDCSGIDVALEESARRMGGIFPLN